MQYLNVVKFPINLNFSFKQARSYYLTTKRQKATQLHAIQLLTTDARQKYAAQMEKLWTRIRELRQQGQSELNQKLSEQKLKQLGLLVFRANSKISGFR